MEGDWEERKLPIQAGRCPVLGKEGESQEKTDPTHKTYRKGKAGERMSWIKTSWEDVNHDVREELQEEEENGGNSTRFQQFRASEERQSMCINLCGACFTECAGFLPKNNWWLGLLLVFKPYSTVGKVCWLNLSQARMFFSVQSDIGTIYMFPNIWCICCVSSQLYQQ